MSNDHVDNIKTMIKELSEIYLSLPESKIKNEFSAILFMLRRNAPLKNIILKINHFIEKTESPSYSNATQREIDKLFWEHILKKIINYIPNSDTFNKEII